MTDERPRVNHPLSADCVEAHAHAQQAVHGALSYCAKHLCAVRSLSNVLTSPTKERTELVRKNHEVDDERYRGQHKYQVSHGSFPALICAVRSLPNRVIKVRQ